MKHQHIYDLCKQLMHSYVLAETEDGKKFDGILTGLDEEYAFFAVPIDSEMGQFHHYSHPMMDYENSGSPYVLPGNTPSDHHHNMGFHSPFRHTSEVQPEKMQSDMRQPYGYGYPQYGWGYPGYGYQPRRFSRLVLPLAALVALTAIPWY